MRAAATIISIALILAVNARAAPPVSKYSVVEVPSLGRPYTDMQATAINNRGDIVGNATTIYGRTESRAFYYQRSSGAVDLLTMIPDFNATFAYGINDNGLIAGGQAGYYHPPVIWTNIGGMDVLPNPYYYGIAFALNNNRVIVGQSGGEPQATIWTGSQHAMTVLGMLPCPPSPSHCYFPSSRANAVNNRGHVVGTSLYFYVGINSGGMHAFEWQDGQITDLGALNDSNDSVAYGINDSDEIVGKSTLEPGGDCTHAFLFRRGTMIDLGTLQGDSESSADAINDAGTIVGRSGPCVVNFTASRAFLYSNGQMYDLTALIDRASEFYGLVSLTEANAINSNGWIAATGTDSRDNLKHVFLLKPVVGP